MLLERYWFSFEKKSVIVSFVWALLKCIKNIFENMVFIDIP